jgi:hypothetical protein
MLQITMGIDSFHVPERKFISKNPLGLLLKGDIIYWRGQYGRDGLTEFLMSPHSS